MWRYTQEISIVVFVLLCVAVLALIALVISRAVKHKKTPIIIYILLAVSTFIEVYGQAIFDELHGGGVFGGFTDMQVTDGVILQSLYGAPLAEVGDQYILFLGKQKTEGRIQGTYVPMGNFMGKYVLDTNTNLYIRFFPLENPYFYAIEDSSTGNILIEQPMSLSDIKDSIAGVD